MMTRVSAAKAVAADFWQGRLNAARAFRQAASDGVTLAAEGRNMNPEVSQMTLAAIAYCDALTARLAGKINQQDHAAAARLLRDVMGNALPQSQETRLRRLLGHKDAAQYGIRPTSLDQARRFLDDLTVFADWVEDQLPSPTGAA